MNEKTSVPGYGLATGSCYTDDWRRTKPDLVIFLPPKPRGNDAYNNEIYVDVTPEGHLLAVWTTGSVEGAPDMRMVFARSEDEGRTWVSPQEMAGPGDMLGLLSVFGFPIISRSGRIYCFYQQTIGIADAGMYSSVIRIAYSDDDGRNWNHAGIDIPWRRTRYDHPDPSVPPQCIFWQKPIRDAKGRLLVGFSRWSSFQVFPRPVGGNRNHLDTQCELIRFDNIDDGPDPKSLKMTWLPDEVGVIRVPPPIEPECSRGYSLAEEPALALLPDGRLWMNMRTVTGRIWYTISDDHGHSWRKPEVLRYRDDGAEVLHPKCPCPIYRLSDGRYLLFYHNHDGYSYGGTGPWDMNARRPLFISVGEFRPKAQQPIWFSAPKLYCDSQGVGVGPEHLIWLAMYSSMTEHRGKCVHWYADRNHFLLGRYITDEMLAGMTTPK